MDDVDLVADLNALDDDGLGSPTLAGARDPHDVRLGVRLVAVNRNASAVVRVTAVDDDGQVHFALVPRPD